MTEILKALTFDDLPMKPPLVGRPRISEDIQQTAALLVGWDGRTRRLVAVSPTGVIRVGSGQAAGVLDIEASGAGDTITPADTPTSEIMLRAYPTNIGSVFVNIGKAAAENTGYPLLAGEWISISVNNLNSLQLWIEKNLDQVAVIYTR